MAELSTLKLYNWTLDMSSELNQYNASLTRVKEHMIEIEKELDADDTTKYKNAWTKLHKTLESCSAQLDKAVKHYEERQEELQKTIGESESVDELNVSTTISDVDELAAEINALDWGNSGGAADASTGSSAPATNP